MQFIRRAEVLRRTGLSRSTMNKMIAEGRFPRGFPLGGEGSRTLGFAVHEIDAWCEEQLARRDRLAAERAAG